ncbi:5-oxoprolinase subunit PxpA [Sphingorhabdus sp. Alg231-15]|uniref:5-oxoprolinase subunit PxpA n=1 Tax=Sphingorhabdus sp. Alg231-15 TaxID=1922222 RepID=UPI00307C879C
MKTTIDLNADLGEAETTDGMARDIAIMDIVSSCNIACGGHAGSPKTMRAMLTAAKEKAVSAGAHPSYPDRENFGRVSMIIDPEDLKASIWEQLRRIKSIAAEIGVSITHLKPHGALYNDAQDSDSLAELLVGIAHGAQLPLVGMADSVIEAKAKQSGVHFIAEAFIDRRYTEYSRLVPRTEQNAVIADDAARIGQGLALAQALPIEVSGDQPRTIKTETLCLHSDSEGALATAAAMRQALENEGFSIAASTG